MSQSGPLPYLSFCGTEIANAARTVEYLRAGLGDTLQGHWELGEGELCSVLYRLNGGSVAAPDVFVGPAADPAPWYDPLEPGSEDFLGIVLLDLKGYDSTISRKVADRGGGLGGGVLAGQRRIPRVWKFVGALVSSSADGAEYGLRWLTHALQSAACDTCSTCDLTVRLTCPPADGLDDDRGEWTSYDVALTSGPIETKTFAPGSPEGILAGCRDYVVVEWTMVAANPYLYRRAEGCLSAPVVIGYDDPDCDDIYSAPGAFYPGGLYLGGDLAPADTGPGDPVCCEVEPPARGTLGAIFTLESESGMGSVLLEAHVQCPASDEDEPALQMQLTDIPANSVVVVNGATRTITVTTTNPDTLVSTVEDGLYLVTLPVGRGLEWVEVRDCDELYCVCVRTANVCSGGSDTTVDVALQAREG